MRKKGEKKTKRKENPNIHVYIMIILDLLSNAYLQSLRYLQGKKSTCTKVISILKRDTNISHLIIIYVQYKYKDRLGGYKHNVIQKHENKMFV
jgi:hypothetical protein